MINFRKRKNVLNQILKADSSGLAFASQKNSKKQLLFCYDDDSHYDNDLDVWPKDLLIARRQIFHYRKILLYSSHQDTTDWPAFIIWDQGWKIESSTSLKLGILIKDA